MNTRSLRHLPLYALIALASAACAPAIDPAVAPQESTGMSADMAVPAEAQVAARGFIAAWNQKDPNVVMAYLSDDATVKLPDGTMFSGSDALRSRWVTQELPKITTLTTSNETAMMVQNGTVVHATGNYAQHTDGSTEAGRYMAMWTRQADGSWKITSFEVMATQ